MRNSVIRIVSYIKPSIRAFAALLLVAAALLPAFATGRASAAVQNPTPTAQISFTFDDGYSSNLSQAQPTLTKYGLTGTAYIITGCVGMTTAPNSCRANTDATYMSWAQIQQLKTAGWEIGSHTVTHPYLATSDASDGQPNPLTQSQVVQELTNSKSALAAQGINATSFASPYGDYNNYTLTQIAKLYTSHRGFADTGNNVWPYNDYILQDMPVQEGVTVAQVKAKIDAAIANKHWLILTMHDIKPTPSTNPADYEYATAKLDQIAAYVKTKQTAGLIKPVNVSSGIVTSDTNLLPNSSFDNGIADGWRTDAPASITKDSAGNGSTPSPTNSIKFVATGANTHLFSPQITVNPNVTYGLKNYVHMQSRTSGELGFFIDEYNASGAWISGQYKGGAQSAFTQNFNFSYKPTSAQVSKASVQVIATGGSGITAYLDNAQWFALNDAAPPPPAATNLVANGTFDTGIADGWTTDDPANITKDTNNNGSPNNPVNSVSIKSVAKNIHLFSPQIAVDSTKIYSLTTYVNLKQISGGGEVGFFMDEYDANGNWISGQYKSGVRAVSASDFKFNYQPSSANVKKASLQIIATNNSSIVAYVDDVRWLLTN